MIEDQQPLKPGEIIDFLKSMSIVVAAITGPNVVQRSIYIEDAEPDTTAGGWMGNHKNAYSFDISCSLMEDFCFGLVYSVKIKTRNEEIKRIVEGAIAGLNVDQHL